MAAVATLIQRRRPDVLPHLRHRATNAGLEGANAVIQWVKKTARGFRDAERFETAIAFRCGGLDRYPRESRWSPE
jgi:transposase